MARPQVSEKVHITIDKQKCTGCGICAAFCPRGVLKKEIGYVDVIDAEKCNVCRLCELRCPDIAILVVTDKE